MIYGIATGVCLAVLAGAFVYEARRMKQQQEEDRLMINEFIRMKSGFSQHQAR